MRLLKSMKWIIYRKITVLLYKFLKYLIRELKWKKNDGQDRQTILENVVGVSILYNSLEYKLSTGAQQKVIKINRARSFFFNLKILNM